MLTEYLEAAMKNATYEILPDDKSYYGRIPGFLGVWANSPTLEGCRVELREVLEGWLIVGIRHGHSLPVVDSLDLNKGIGDQDAGRA